MAHCVLLLLVCVCIWIVRAPIQVLGDAVYTRRHTHTPTHTHADTCTHTQGSAFYQIKRYPVRKATSGGGFTRASRFGNTYGEVLGTYGEVLGTYGEVLGTYGEVLHTYGEVLHTYGEVLGTYGEVLGTSFASLSLLFPSSICAAFLRQFPIIEDSKVSIPF